MPIVMTAKTVYNYIIYNIIILYYMAIHFQPNGQKQLFNIGLLSSYCCYRYCTITDLVVDELPNKLVIGVNEFTVAFSSPILPQSNIARPGVGVRV